MNSKISNKDAHQAELNKEALQQSIRLCVCCRQGYIRLIKSVYRTSLALQQRLRVVHACARREYRFACNEEWIAPASALFSSAALLAGADARLGVVLPLLERVCRPPALRAFSTGKAALA